MQRLGTIPISDLTYESFMPDGMRKHLKGTAPLSKYVKKAIERSVDRGVLEKIESPNRDGKYFIRIPNAVMVSGIN